MSDRVVYSCRECSNAVVAGLNPPPTFECPACGFGPGDVEDPYNQIWNREGRIR